MSEIIWVAVGVCLAFSFWNGFTDAAYSISTIIATRVLTPIRAVALASAGNFVGLLFGGAVATTIGKGIIDTADPAIISVMPHIVIAALLGGLLFNILTWWLALPVSESHILIGGLVGAGSAAAGTGVVLWNGLVSKVLVPMIVAPLVGFTVAFLLTVGIMHAFRRRSQERVNRGFAKVQLGSSFFAAVMHGSNDGQKFVGILTALLLAAAWIPSRDAPLWVILAAFGTVSLGTLLGGWRIVRTLAVKITNLKPYQGVAAEGGGALILAVTAATGSPVSTTHAFTAAIMGVGATRRLSAVRWGLARRIVLTWIVTMPTAAVFAYGTFLLLALPNGWVLLGGIVSLVIALIALRPMVRRKLLARDEATLAAAGGSPPG